MPKNAGTPQQPATALCRKPAIIGQHRSRARRSERQYARRGCRCRHPAGRIGCARRAHERIDEHGAQIPHRAGNPARQTRRNSGSLATTGSRCRHRRIATSGRTATSALSENCRTTQRKTRPSRANAGGGNHLADAGIINGRCRFPHRAAARRTRRTRFGTHPISSRRQQRQSATAVE